MRGIEMFEHLNDLCEWLHRMERQCFEDYKIFDKADEPTATALCLHKSLAFYQCWAKTNQMMAEIFG